MIDAAKALLGAGVPVLQFRHKGLWRLEILEDAARIRDLCRTHQALFVINDRADYARMLAAGVHLGQEDLPPAIVRNLLGPGNTLGYSTHNLAQLTAAGAEPVDYIALGPIYPTASKRNPDPVVGVARIKEWRAVTPKPLVAIGGITRENASAVWNAGADMVAVIGDLYPESCTPQSIEERMKEWLLLTRM